MSASKRQMNTRNGSFTPTSGSATSFTGITAATIGGGGSAQKFSGDGDLFTTCLVHDFSDPSISITMADMAAAGANGIGSRGTVAITFKDAKNQSPSSAPGDITFVMSTAMVSNIDFSQSYRQFGTATVMFASESADGVTSPISFSVS